MKALLLLTALTVMLAQKTTSETEQFEQSASNSSHDEKVCSSDSVFNKVLQVCDKDGAKHNLTKENIEERSICIDGNIKQSTDDTGYLICIGNVWRKRLCPAEHVFSAIKVACIPGSSEDGHLGCTPGIIRPHPSNNKKFYICINNEWRVHSCPDAKFFDKRISICVKTKKKLDLSPTECKEGCVQQDSECCEKFFVCEDGKWKRRSCPSSKYFDPQHKACVIDLFGYCRKTTPKPRPKCEDGCIKQDPNCCERYLECVHGEWVQRPCPKGLYFDSSKQTCIVDVNGVCIIHPTTKKPIECTDGRVKQDTECCDKFYCCENGEWSRRSCPSGQYFDPQHQACVLDVFDYCRKTTPRPRPKCENGCVKKDPSCCDKYLECVHGEWMQRQCPKGLSFDSSKQACVLDILGGCIKHPTTPKPVECAEGCFKQDSDCCEKFYSCENGIWNQRSCPSDQYFDPYSNACVKDSYNFCRNRKCENGHVKQDPNSCDKYLECVHGDWIQRPCPNGLYFDPNKGACMYDTMGVCIKNSTIQKPDECIDGCVKQDSDCCDKFYSCENSKWIRRPCPSGQYFDPQRQICLIDEFGYCRKTTPKPRPKCDDRCVKQDPNCCAKYFQCIHGEWVQRPCPKGLYFDPRKQTCIVDVLGVCRKY